MTRPGDRLRKLAARACSAAAMEQVIDPLLADLHREHYEARRRGFAWRRRWRYGAGCVAFWKVLAIEVVEESVASVREFAHADDRAMARLVAFSGLALAIGLVVHILSWMPAFDRLEGFDWWKAAACFIPGGLAMGIQVALCIGIAAAFRARDVSPRVQRRVLAVAVGCSLFALLNVGWILPNANQTFRELAAGHRVFRGANELTFSELSHSRHVFAFHVRLAISMAPLTHAFFALVARRRTRWPVMAMIAVWIVYVAYYTTLASMADTPVTPWPLAMTAAWAPNVLLGAAAFALSSPTTSSSSPRTPSTAG